MEWWSATDSEWARQVVQRGVAALYLVAFWSTLNQFRALLGEHGLLPAPALLAAGRQRGPTVFSRWRYTDRRLVGVAVAGMVLAAALVAGLPQAGPPWVPLAVFLVLYGLYLSIVNIGQAFYGFGWEMLLLEAGIMAGLLGSDRSAPLLPVVVLIAWLVFRLEFGAGMIKMRGGPEWRDLTAMDYHHQTQPMPNPLSRQAHLKPRWWHRAEVIGNHVTQLGMPWLLFLPQPVASIGAAVIIVTQSWLVATGNYAWLNWATIVLACSALGDRVLHAVLPALPADLGTDAEPPLYWTVIVLVACAGIVVASVPAVRNLFSRRQLMNASFNRWQVGNAYGAFGSVTKVRIEVIVEGTEQGSVDEPPPEESWRAYGFRGKPGDLARRPRQFAPYHLRLDWMMWFLPLSGIHQRWFHALLAKLLVADPATLRLLRHDPFAGRPPALIRVRTFRYRYATRAERRATGAYWVRDMGRTEIWPVALRG
ncbi:lipase maturation factor family protein [Citricoccus sp. SGAir0253]|uniref:lipase maturation factor family protein n=1 Tax=Citricoccus sp. SGAir0253 TaxID=2567881 RepID=UPI0010CCD917|nr:lipase maturation factor family protein [Citricoccus sp. SGAir0253]QCU78548.1 lipase maturation factor family protein [Citricoccus sp. SGAir0253]